MNDPFVKVAEILKKVKNLMNAQNSGDSLAYEKALSKFTDGQMFYGHNQVPNTRDEWIDFF